MSSSAVFVTGATGFIGSALVDRLQEKRFQVRKLVRRQADGDRIAAGSQIVCGDICFPDSYRGLLDGADTVVHLAGRVHETSDQAEVADDLYREVNVQATVRLADRAIAAGVRRFIFVSSISVYGGQLGLGRPVSEATPTDPITPYGRSKLEAEERLQELSAQSGMELVIVRPALVVDQGAPGNLQRLKKLVLLGIPLPRLLKNNVRSFVSRETLVEVLTACVERRGVSGEIFLVADKVKPSTHQVVEWISRGAGRKLISPRIPNSVLRLIFWIFGSGKVFEKVFGDLLVDGDKVERVFGPFPEDRLRNAFTRLGAEE